MTESDSRGKVIAEGPRIDRRACGGVDSRRRSSFSRDVQPNGRPAMRRLIAVVSAVLALSATLVWAEPLPSAHPEQVGLSPERLHPHGHPRRGGSEKGTVPGARAAPAPEGPG